MRENALIGKASWNSAARSHVEVRDGEIRGNGAILPLRRVAAGDVKSPPIVHVHGGGWCICDPETHLSIYAGLALASEREVIGPHARCAPEHPFPTPLRDTMAALREIARTSPAGILLSGDSAGANLALAAVLRCRDEGNPLPVLGLSLQYGCYRRVFDTPSHLEWGDGRAGLGTERMRWFWDMYGPGKAPYGDLRNADFSGLPPTHLLVADADPLRDDSLWLADELSREGVHCEVDRFVGMAHGFIHYAGDLSEADEAFKRISSFFDRVLNDSTAAASGTHPPL
ncbi:alpha/beta hydrolase [Aliiruegeria haliotis]|nr:alpha/beta hydrolase [Aliiruegeria haliotis]